MLEYIIAGVIVVITLIFFLKRGGKGEVEKTKPQKKGGKDKKSEQQNYSTPKQNKKSEKIEIDQTPIKNIRTDLEDSGKEKLFNSKEFIINSFKEVKDLKNAYVIDGGKAILISDEKRILLAYLTSFNEKNPKFISKSVEQDVIADVAYSETKKLVAVGLKNSKDIWFYQVEIDADTNKYKLNKVNKKIETKRKFEIRAIAISKDGNFVVTSGTGQDTVLQFYDTAKNQLIENIDTSGIENSDMKITSDDKYLTVSTFMYEIAVIEFKRTEKFNKDINAYEVSTKLQRNKSVSGLKVPIMSYDFSNDNKFFIVSCDDRKIKIFQNFGTFHDSKVFHEFDIKERSFEYAERVSLYVSSYFNSKLDGLIAVAYTNDIAIYDCEGNVLKIFKNAHDSNIILVKLVQDLENANKVCLISASRDGRMHIWNLL
jgi:WD40 repeat protein